MSYTMHDTPRVKQRIDGDLDRVQRVVQAGDPALRALVLTGGFARGEGSVVDGTPQNDYDFVAVRGLGRPRVPYPQMARRLEEELGLHIDLAPVSSWRLPFVSRSIFWYETAMRGRVLWGSDPLHRLPIRTADDLEPTEGLRLLVNRSAGLLLSIDETDAHALRIQASKGILGALDVHLLAMGAFGPSHVERWKEYDGLRAKGHAPPTLEFLGSWLHWAYRFKIEPERAEACDPHEAWRVAARALLRAVPVALRHAGMSSIDAYERRERLIERLYYYRQALTTRPLSPFVRNPTGKVRVATLRLLDASRDGRLDRRLAGRLLGRLDASSADPLASLRRLRGATMQ